MDIFNVLAPHLQAFCARHEKGGVVVALLQAGHTAAQVFGPLALATPLPVASLSKPVFAYAVLKLCEQGQLNLDTPLAAYLPQPYLVDEPFLPLMTARQALSHTTGFPNWRSAAGLRAAFPPGTAFHYSTEGLLYLQTVVEQVTGQPFQDYVQHAVFAPLGMGQSQWVPEDLSTLQPFLPAGLRAYGGIGLHTTALDYARFMQHMLVVSDEMDMLRPQTAVGDQPGLAWGLGWGLQLDTGPAPSFWHWGAKRNLTRNFVMGQPARQTGLVIFTTHPEGLRLCQEIAEIVFAPAAPLPAFRWLLPPERWRADGRV